MALCALLSKNMSKYTPYKMTPAQKGSVQSSIVVQAPLRTNPDIGKWRSALRMAEDVETPDRSMLLDIYEETRLDALVASVTQRIVSKCCNSRIVFTVDGEPDQAHPINQLLAAPVFLRIIRWIIESKWYGHSLIELEFEAGQVKDAHLIPRKNVLPEKGLVVANVGDQKGVAYREPPHQKYVLEVGEPRDLGLLNPATPYVIYKRFALANMGEYVEIYGVPIREFLYDPQVPNSRAETEKQAKKQGASSTVIMPMGTKTNIHKGADGSGSSVFKQAKEMHDEELLLLFVGQSMTTKNGSSRSQAEVHQSGEDEFIMAYKLFVELVLNHQLKPLLQLHGFQLEQGRLQYEVTEKMDKMELLQVIQGLDRFGKVPLDYIEQNFGIKLDPRHEDQPAKPGAAQPTEETEKKKALKYESSCGCAHKPAQVLKFNFSEREEDALLERIWKGRGNSKFDVAYFNALASGLLEQIDTAWPTSDQDLDQPDHLKKTLLELNAYRFSATKDKKLLQELNRFLRSSSNFAEFKAATATVLEDYNEHHLRTEYNLAQATAQSTANYLSNMEVAEEFPYWEYQTAGDDRVRPSHAALDGQLFLAGALGPFTPPNGYGCRCEFVPRSSRGGKPVIDAEAAKALMGEEYKRMQDSGFAVNRAEEGYIFTEDQMYTNLNEKTMSGHKDFGLPAYSKIAQTAPQPKRTKRTEQQAREWFSGRIGSSNQEEQKAIRLLDFNGRPTTLELSTLLKNKAWNVLDLLDEALLNPDEAYMVRQGKGYVLRCVRYYKPKPLVVELAIDKEDSRLVHWGFSGPNTARTGLLIKTK